jgi:hypothetical protein
MYPQRELTRLSAYKAGLQRDLAFRRGQCVEAATAVVQPVEWLDRMIAFCRRVAPAVLFAAVPLGLLARSALFPRAKAPARLLRWGLLVFGAVRLIHSTAGARKERAANPRRNA